MWEAWAQFIKSMFAIILFFAVPFAIIAVVLYILYGIALLIN